MRPTVSMAAQNAKGVLRRVAANKRLELTAAKATMLHAVACQLSHTVDSWYQIAEGHAESCHSAAAAYYRARRYLQAGQMLLATKH